MVLSIITISTFQNSPDSRGNKRVRMIIYWKWPCGLNRNYPVCDTHCCYYQIFLFHFLPYFMEASYHCVYFFLTGLSKTFPVIGELADVLKSVCHMLYTVTVQFLPSNLSAVTDWRSITEGKDCVSTQLYLQLSDWIWNKNGIWLEPCQG